MPLDTVPAPSVELLSENVTVPVGVPVPVLALIMAVNVKLEPCALLAGLTVSMVEVVASLGVLLPPQPSGIMEITAVAQRVSHPRRRRMPGAAKRKSMADTAMPPVAVMRLLWLLCATVA